MVKKPTKNIIFLSVVIVTIITIILLGTYALYTWASSENTELTTTIGNLATVHFNEGDNINVANIGPVFNYEQDGEITTFDVINLTSEELNLQVKINVTTITDNLKESTFKYTLLSSTDNTTFTKVTTGNFLNASNNNSITVASGITLPRKIYFKLIIYIDGNYENPITMQGGSLVGSISVETSLPTDLVLRMPDTFSVGNSTIDTTCSDANVTFNPINMHYKVSSLTKSSGNLCTPTFTSTTRTKLNNHIISLAGTTQGTGQVVPENGYRYEGKNPNNYIYFNNELWRIIGVFDSSSHGVSNTNLVKIIRNDSIGGYAWHKSNTNDWPNSSLYHLLNDYYYTATDGTSSTYCYQYSTTVTGNCNYTKIGLQTDYRNMVQTNTTWYLGGPSDNSNPTSTFYVNERDATKIYSGRSASTTGNIGLMYASDYGYSVLSSSCTRTTNLGSYNTNACAGNAWLKKETYEWTITPYSDRSNYVWYVDITGLVGSSTGASNGYASRPVLYLKSDVTVMGGDGSLASPYQIGI